MTTAHISTSVGSLENDVEELGKSLSSSLASQKCHLHEETKWKETEQQHTKLTTEYNKLEQKIKQLEAEKAELLQVKVDYAQMCGSSLNGMDSEMLDKLLDKLRTAKKLVRDAIQHAKECKICMERHSSVVFVPCGHTVCGTCATKIESCSFCRNRILQKIKIVG